MEPEHTSSELKPEVVPSRLHTITPLSKYLAMIIFIAMPFIGGWIGYNYALTKPAEFKCSLPLPPSTQPPDIISTNAPALSTALSIETMMSCERDSDCTVVQPDCEDCTFSAINYTHLDEFGAQKTSYCTENKPTLQCDVFFNGTTRCINNSCQIVGNE